eukprot:jgi/Chlat1/3542/Chrsp231S08814
MYRIVAGLPALDMRRIGMMTVSDPMPAITHEEYVATHAAMHEALGGDLQSLATVVARAEDAAVPADALAIASAAGGDRASSQRGPQTADVLKLLAGLPDQLLVVVSNAAGPTWRWRRFVLRMLTWANPECTASPEKEGYEVLMNAGLLAALWDAGTGSRAIVQDVLRGLGVKPAGDDDDDKSDNDEAGIAQTD